MVDLDATIKSAAIAYHLNPDHFYAVAAFCEDPGLIVDQQSNYYKNGVREPSFGIYQINLKAHPEITKAEAEDPVWAANWAAQQWVAGNYKQWSCYGIEKAKNWQ